MESGDDQPPALAPHAMAAVDADLGVLLAELNRVRSQSSDDGGAAPTAAEAITLASAAMRLVETQLRLRPPAAMPAEDVDLSREVLRAALEVLRAGLDANADQQHAAERTRPRRWGRRARQPQP